MQTTLTNGHDDCEESVTAIVSLLSMGLKCVPTEVICSKFGPTTQTLLTTLAKFAESDNNNLLKSVSFDNFFFSYYLYNIIFYIDI